MSICRPCAEAADGVDLGPIPVCQECGQGPVYVYNDARPLYEQSVVKHKSPGAPVGDPDYWCVGSTRPPRLSTGHDFCNGCPCHHYPPGTGRVVREESEG